MALQEPQAEPSMEEILASIRKIISEEDEPAAEGACDAEAEVLDLTDQAPEAEAEAPEAPDDIVFETDAASEPAALPEPEDLILAPPAAPALAAPAPPAADMIVSSPSANAAADALARLVGTLRISDTPGQTVEGVVRELLKPLLKDWLDHNLPRIVEARVEAELERIARLAR